MKDGLKKTFEGLECISVTVQMKALSTLPMAAFKMKLLLLLFSLLIQKLKSYLLSQ